jgi:hypothetical protein
MNDRTSAAGSSGRDFCLHLIDADEQLILVGFPAFAHQENSGRKKECEDDCPKRRDPKDFAKLSFRVSGDSRSMARRIGAPIAKTKIADFASVYFLIPSFLKSRV